MVSTYRQSKYQRTQNLEAEFSSKFLPGFSASTYGDISDAVFVLFPINS
jgi:hypothetical protein